MKICAVIAVLVLMAAQAVATELDYPFGMHGSSIGRDLYQKNPPLSGSQITTVATKYTGKQHRTCMSTNEAVNCGVGTCSDGYKCCAVGISRYCCPAGTSCDDYDKGKCVDTK